MAAGRPCSRPRVVTALRLPVGWQEAGVVGGTTAVGGLAATWVAAVRRGRCLALRASSPERLLVWVRVITCAGHAPSACHVVSLCLCVCTSTPRTALSFPDLTCPALPCPCLPPPACPQVEAAVLCVAGVEGVHELHIWAITLGRTVLACHVEVGPGTCADLVLRDVLRCCREQFGIEHATVQVERRAAAVGAGGEPLALPASGENE